MKGKSLQEENGTVALPRSPSLSSKLDSYSNAFESTIVSKLIHGFGPQGQITIPGRHFPVLFKKEKSFFHSTHTPAQHFSLLYKTQQIILLAAHERLLFQESLIHTD